MRSGLHVGHAENGPRHFFELAATLFRITGGLSADFRFDDGHRDWKRKHFQNPVPHQFSAKRMSLERRWRGKSVPINVTVKNPLTIPSGDIGRREDAVFGEKRTQDSVGFAIEEIAVGGATKDDIRLQPHATPISEEKGIKLEQFSIRSSTLQTQHNSCTGGCSEIMKRGGPWLDLHLACHHGAILGGDGRFLHMRHGLESSF